MCCWHEISRCVVAMVGVRDTELRDRSMNKWKENLQVMTSAGPATVKRSRSYLSANEGRCGYGDILTDIMAPI